MVLSLEKRSAMTDRREAGGQKWTTSGRPGPALKHIGFKMEGK